MLINTLTKQASFEENLTGFSIGSPNLTLLVLDSRGAMVGNVFRYLAHLQLLV